MTLNWIIDNDTLHTACFDDASEASMASVIDQAMEKSVALLPTNIKDDSRFLLLEWDSASKTLLIVISDESKTRDSDQVVKLVFTGDIKDMDEFIADLKYYSKNFLTTCSDFMNYSLIAAFCSAGRNSTQLL